MPEIDVTVKCKTVAEAKSTLANINDIDLQEALLGLATPQPGTPPPRPQREVMLRGDAERGDAGRY